MEDVRKALTEMNRRLYRVESDVKKLNLQVAETTASNTASLTRMEAHAEAMRREAEAMRQDAEAMRQESEAMRIEGARNAAVFDQVTAEMVENLQGYQKNVGIVLEFVVNKAAAHDEEHAEINRRLDALETKLA